MNVCSVIDRVQCEGDAQGGLSTLIYSFSSSSDTPEFALLYNCGPSLQLSTSPLITAFHGPIILRQRHLATMKFITMFGLVSAALLPAVIAAPPGVQWYQTFGDVGVCGEALPGDDLFSIGFSGQPGTGCLSLPDDAATLDHLVYYVWSTCNLTVFAGAGCSPDDTVLTVPNPPFGTDASACVELSEGFRSLDVTCTVFDLISATHKIRSICYLSDWVVVLSMVSEDPDDSDKKVYQIQRAPRPIRKPPPHQKGNVLPGEDAVRNAHEPAVPAFSPTIQTSKADKHQELSALALPALRRQ
ncbi:hypothetical protein NM688_g159 [Phlebia brevispora]|uniref:Uncharacterized protein n=1 Tax=Phlebia brevispora TaxID=194682 RepID=A0ACC1TFD4_9APHY|nr:hypothetical protein NM688_g159 [Phlebia brevispora]